MILTAIYDTQTDAILPQVFSTENEMTAKRMFKSAPLARLGLEIVAANPDDFWLVKLGDLHQEGIGDVAPESKRLFCFAEVIKNG